MALVLYGIRNCDTMKKAWSWLDAHGVAYTLHDYKKLGAPREAVERWVDLLGCEAVLNRAGTTVRKLPEAQRADLTRDRAVALMVAQPSMIRRPVVEGANGSGPVLLAGFRPEVYAATFG